MEKLPSAIQHLYTIVLILVSWAIFAIEDIEQLAGYLIAMFGLRDSTLWSSFETYNLNNYGVVLLLCVICSTPVYKLVCEKMTENVKKVFTLIYLIVSLIVCTSYLVAGTYNPFLYFRF